MPMREELCVCFNVAGLDNKMDEVINLFFERKPLVGCVTETHVTEVIQDQEIFIPGYRHFICFSHSRHTGGVVIYVKDHVPANVIKCETDLSAYWALLVKLKLYGENIVVGAIYRSPNSNVDIFHVFWDILINDPIAASNQTIIAGDFNICCKSDTPACRKLQNVAKDAGFKQIIEKATRVTLNSNSLIDLVFTNDYSLRESDRNFPQFSDHMTVGFLISNKSCIEKSRYKNVRNLKQENMDLIKVELITTNWNYTSTNVDELYEDFLQNITNAVDKVAPLKTVKVYTTPWITNNVRAAQKERDNAYKKFQLTKLESDWDNYKYKRNRCVTIIRSEKTKYFEESIDQCKSDGKKMWRTLKDIVGRNVTHDSLFQNISFPHKEETVENNFNKFYAESIVQIANSIPTQIMVYNVCNDVPLVGIKLERFDPVNLANLRALIMNLKNKSTSDEICNIKCLKSVFGQVGYPLLHLVNTSILGGKVPKKAKVSVIVPIPKIQNPTKPEEFRPINLLPVVDKILETVVCKQIRKYFENKNFIFTGQSGFREKHSCESALQYVCTEWRKCIDGGNITVCVFVDLKRAFETINREDLVKKLEGYGVKGTALDWLRNYLHERYHKTKVNGVVSEAVKNNIGVPQGSVLGPLLFIIYINDLYKILKKAKLSLFADDTLLWVSGKDYDKIITDINFELSLLYNWLCVNKLKLNSEKTKYMVLGNKQKCKEFNEKNYTIHIGGNKIEFVYQIKYLGVFLDPQLNFSSHIDFICKKIGKKIGFFYRISQNLSQWAKLLIYNTIIYPHFNYCCSLLLACNKAEINRLQLLQNKAMRIILKCNKYTPIKMMLNSLGWLNVEQIIELSNIVIIFKIKNNLMPSYLQNFLVTRSERHSYNTRTKDHFEIQYERSTYMQKHLFSNGLRFYNALSNEIKSIKSLKLFIKHTKMFYLQK